MKDNVSKEILQIVRICAAVKNVENNKFLFHNANNVWFALKYTEKVLTPAVEELHQMITRERSLDYE